MSDDRRCLSSSFCGGVAATTITSPIWMVKTRMQLNEQKGVVSPFLVCKEIMKQEGLKYFWKGIGASWMGVFETCTQWMLLEKIRQQHHVVTAQKTDSRQEFVYAACSKLIATSLWYPHEVVRTRMREKNNTYKNMVDCVMRIARSESLMAFYSGLGIQLVRVVPNFALTVSIYRCLIQ